MDGQLGLERTPDEYVANMVAVFREVRRVLRDDGTCWVVLGDSYANDGKWGGSTGGKHADGLHGATRIGRARTHTGLKPKELVGIPWRVAFALQADGWYLRSDIIWAKPNPMPESITDRPTKAHEYLFILTKSERYYFDQEAVKEANASGPSDMRKMAEQRQRIGGMTKDTDAPMNAANKDTNIGQKRGVGSGNGRNLRSVWTIATEPTPFAHFATFPRKLVEPCIKAGTSERGCCPECGKPWERVVEVEYVKSPVHGPGSVVGRHEATGQNNFDGAGMPRLNKNSRTIGWQPGCSCDAGDPIPCTVMDPFMGAGTTGLVAAILQRNWIGCELNQEYADLAQARIDAGGDLGIMRQAEAGQMALAVD